MTFAKSLFCIFVFTAASSALGFEQKFGFRLQAFVESSETEEVETQDMYFRRTRLEYGAKFEDRYSFKMDVRSDRVNQEDRGERTFQVGDAYVEYKLSPITKFRFGRAKVDISRTQTISSADLIHPNRAAITDFAAEHISQSRRAVNLQILQTPAQWFAYQLYIGDGINSKSFKSALGQGAVDEVVSQNFTVGGKLKFYPFKEWQSKKLDETYFGKGKHFSFGFGAGSAQKAKIETTGNAQETLNPSVQNFEISAHAERFGFQAEWFSFNDVVQSFDNLETGRGEGGYAQAEVLFNEGKIAPFLRYDVWDRYIDSRDFAQNGVLGGINYYPVRGEEIRYGASYQQTTFGKDLEEFFGEEEKAYSLYMMLHY